MKLKYLILLLHMCSVMVLAQEQYTPTMEKHEKKFRESIEYQLEDFNFAWDVTFFKVLWYYVHMDKKYTYQLNEKVDFRIIFQSSARQFSALDQKQRWWIASALLKPSYFWQAEQAPYPLYSFRTLIFKGKKGNLKAIESRSEILQMLGEIDTEAELLLWLHSTPSETRRPFSYKKIGEFYRVRYSNLFMPTCHYREYFDYYDRKGKLIKTQKIRSFHDKTCKPVTP